MTPPNQRPTDETQQLLIARVERLWRKARSSPYPHEAQAYEEKALYLMARSRITHAMLDLDESADTIIDVEIGAPLTGGYNAPAEALFGVVCSAYGCRPYFAVRGRRSQPWAVGFERDIHHVTTIWRILLADALSASSELKGSNAAHTKALRRSALFGYVEAISERFDRINRIAVGDAADGHDQSADDAHLDGSRQASNAGMALVFKSREEQVAAVFEAKPLTTRRGAVSAGFGGRDHGYAAGMQADISGGRRRVAGASGELTA